MDLSYCSCNTGTLCCHTVLIFSRKLSSRNSEAVLCICCKEGKHILDEAEKENQAVLPY